MQRSMSRTRVDQLTLFCPPRKTPAWDTLPIEVKGKTRTLLARMLREHRARPGRDKTKEVSDE